MQGLCARVTFAMRRAPPVFPVCGPAAVMSSLQVRRVALPVGVGQAACQSVLV